jgi:acyl-CoA synthetase (AMP-forming)/AMP-acid ligase II
MITHGNIICSTFQGITTNFWVHFFHLYAQALLTSALQNNKGQTNGAQPVTTQPVAICPLPMFHTFGLHSYILRSTLSPTTYVILGSWNTTQYLKAISRYVDRPPFSFAPLAHKSQVSAEEPHARPVPCPPAAHPPRHQDNRLQLRRHRRLGCSVPAPRARRTAWALPQGAVHNQIRYALPTHVLLHRLHQRRVRPLRGGESPSLSPHTRV